MDVSLRSESPSGPTLPPAWWAVRSIAVSSPEFIVWAARGSRFRDFRYGPPRATLEKATGALPKGMSCPLREMPTGLRHT